MRGAAAVQRCGATQRPTPVMTAFNAMSSLQSAHRQTCSRFTDSEQKGDYVLTDVNIYIDIVIVIVMTDVIDIDIDIKTKSQRSLTLLSLTLSLTA